MHEPDKQGLSFTPLKPHPRTDDYADIGILDAAQLGAFQKEIAHIVVLVLVLVAVVVLVGVGIAVVVMQDTQLYGIAAWLPSYPEDTTHAYPVDTPRR